MPLFARPGEDALVLELGARKGFPPPAGVSLDHPPLPAFVNRDRWVVECPFCHNGIHVPPDLGPVWCCNCGFTGVAGQRIRVAMPADADDIADIVAARPDPVTRNWPLGATVDELLLDSVNNLRAVDGVVPGRFQARALALLEADWVRRGLAAQMAAFNGEG
jgi:hypothetical protein